MICLLQSKYPASRENVGNITHNCIFCQLILRHSNKTKVLILPTKYQIKYLIFELSYYLIDNLIFFKIYHFCVCKYEARSDFGIRQMPNFASGNCNMFLLFIFMFLPMFSYERTTYEMLSKNVILKGKNGQNTFC